MLIRPADLARIRDGEIDLAFRRWERPRVLVGTREVGYRLSPRGAALVSRW